MTTSLRFGLIFLSLLSCLAMAAESRKAPEEEDYSKPRKASPGVQVFDDKVFELSRDKPREDTVRTSPRGNTLYVDEEPDYNTKNRQDWMDACAEFRGQPKKYRECFGKKKAEAAQRGTVPEPAPPAKTSAMPNRENSAVPAELDAPSGDGSSEDMSEEE